MRTLGFPSDLRRLSDFSIPPDGPEVMAVGHTLKQKMEERAGQQELAAGGLSNAQLSPSSRPFCQQPRMLEAKSLTSKSSE